MIRTTCLLLMAMLFSDIADPFTLYAQEQAAVTGEYYDWTKTMKPERPWIHDYSQTVVMKLFLCAANAKEDDIKVFLTFEDALAVIKKLDKITLGIPKIVYLVGWQFNGHDTGYPAWDKVNDKLKRKEDKTALASLNWLMNEAYKYHTTVSLHINMFDAYQNSPLWSTYMKHDIVIKDKSGEPVKGEVFDGRQSYQVSYRREWETGYAQKRIDGLIKMLPALKKAGTIHIDAFHSIQPSRQTDTIISSPYLNYKVDDEVATQRKIYRYWRNNGIDVTSEGDIYWLRKDPFIGLQPMSWHYNIQDFYDNNWVNKPADLKGLPATLYCGTPMSAEGEVKKDRDDLSPLVKQFCLQVVPWYYRNNLSHKTVEDDLTAGNIFMPVLWLENTIVGYSEKGYTGKKWSLPKEWYNTKYVSLGRLTVDGVRKTSLLPVISNQVTLTLAEGEGVVIKKM